MGSLVKCVFINVFNTVKTRGCGCIAAMPRNTLSSRMYVVFTLTHCSKRDARIDDIILGIART